MMGDAYQPARCLVCVRARVEPRGRPSVEVSHGAPHAAHKVEAHLPPAREAEAEVWPEEEEEPLRDDGADVGEGLQSALDPPTSG